MATVKIYDQNRQETGEITLSPEVFEIEARPEILNFVVRSQMAARRSGTHNAKTRAQVSGGGNKPWKQKGTGRARAGSNRSPIWRGGAVIFGPVPRDYGFKVNKKIRALAMRMALSSKLQSDALMIVDKIDLPEAKTKLFSAIKNSLGLEKALIITPEKNEALVRSSRNIQGIATTTPDQLNVLEILDYKQLVILVGAIKPIEARFIGEEA